MRNLRLHVLCAELLKRRVCVEYACVCVCVNVSA